MRRPIEMCGATEPSTASMPRLVRAHHHAGRLDDGVGGLALFELELVNRVIGDGCGDDRAADVDTDMRGRCAFFHIDDLAFELIARAKFHGNPLLVSFSRCEAVACKNLLTLRR